MAVSDVVVKRYFADLRCALVRSSSPFSVYFLRPNAFSLPGRLVTSIFQGFSKRTKHFFLVIFLA